MAPSASPPAEAMTLDQRKAFLTRMQNNDDLRQSVTNLASADDVAQITAGPVRQGHRCQEGHPR